MYQCSGGIELLTLDMLNCFKDYEDTFSFQIISRNHLGSCRWNTCHPKARLQPASLFQSIPFLLMPWRLQEPDHQQAWYWPWKPKYSIFSIRRVKNTTHISSPQMSQLLGIYCIIYYGHGHIKSGGTMTILCTYTSIIYTDLRHR